MKNGLLFSRIIPITLCCSLLLSGCSILDITDKLRDKDKLTAQLHESPRFWYDTVAIDGYSNLHQLYNEFFKGKPYNNIKAFGDNILLIGQGQYDKDKNSLIDQISDKFNNRASKEEDEGWDDESYVEEDYNEDEAPEEVAFEYSFDVYNPWKNSITASLAHDEITCDDYIVAGDMLYLINIENSTIAAYDSNLNFIQSYDASDLIENQNFNLQGSKDGNSCYATIKDSNLFYEVEKDNFFCKTQTTGLYAPQILSVSESGKYLLLAGVDKKTLKYTTAVYDTETFDIVSSESNETYQGGSVTDNACVYSHDSVYNDWLYKDFDNIELYFYLDELRNVELINDTTMLLHQEEYFDASSTGNHTVSYYEMDSTGNCLSAFTFDCGYLTSSAFSYFSSDYVYLKDANCVMFLVYTTSVNPYLLVWNLNDKGTATDIVSSDNEDEVLSQAKADYFAKRQEEANTENTEETGDRNLEDTDNVVTLIENPDTYEWGDLSDVYKTVSSLEETYDIEIYFGPEVPDTIDSFKTGQDRDASHIKKALSSLENMLTCYPTNFFTQLSYGRLKGIRIYLAGNLTGESDEYIENPSAFTCIIDNYQVMVLDTSYSWDWNYTVNHELAHMIDRRLEFLAMYNPNILFSEEAWNNYNPEGFEYLNSYEDYENSTAYNGNEDYFCDKYGTTFATEDRAEIFGRAMDDYLVEQYYDEDFAADSILKNKLKFYCLCIRDGFNTAGWPAQVPWESLFK